MMILRVDEIDLFNIPKVELHCHLELAYRPKTMKSWAIQDGDLPEGCSDEEFKAKYMILSPMNNLPNVLNKFLVTRDRIKTLERIEQLTLKHVKTCVLFQMRILELRYAPSFVLQVYPELGTDRMHEAIMRGCTEQKKIPLWQWALCLLRRTTRSENEYWVILH